MKMTFYSLFIGFIIGYYHDINKMYLVSDGDLRNVDCFKIF